MELENILDTTYKLPKESLLLFTSKFSVQHFKKGTILYQNIQNKSFFYLIKKGIVRAFIDDFDSSITFWFGSEGDPILFMKNYVENTLSYEKIELLEDCELYVMDMQELQELYCKDIFIANWGRKFAENELLKTEKRLISKQFKNATERYLELLEKNPQFIKRIALGYIASYLGITQVSLSRIRAEIK